MQTRRIEYAVVSALVLGAILAICIAHGNILLPMLAVITLAVSVYDLFKGNGGNGRLCRKVRKIIQTQSLRINLRYKRAELKQILRYAKAHDVERNGRYDFKQPPRLNIWTHAWRNTGCRDESCVMFSLKFNRKTSALISVVRMPGFDFEAFVDELAMLETAALGKSVYGRQDST